MRFDKKILTLILVGLFFGASCFPSVIGIYNNSFEEYHSSVSSIFDHHLILDQDDNDGSEEDDDEGGTGNDCANNETFEDYLDDVFSYTFDLTTNGEMIRTDKKPNINIISGSYVENDGIVTLTFEVEGIIENKCSYENDTMITNVVEYSLLLTTSKKEYSFYYCNNSCLYREESDDGYEEVPFYDYTVSGSVLTINCPLESTSEHVESLLVGTMYTFIDEQDYNFEISFDFAINLEYSMTTTITKPVDALYAFDKRIIGFSYPVVLGKISVEYEEIFDENGSLSLGFAELYVDDQLIATPDVMDMSLIWSNLSFGKHTLKVISFDAFGNRGSDEIEVWKFF